jgi:hypothetical protein
MLTQFFDKTIVLWIQQKLVLLKIPLKWQTFASLYCMIEIVERQIQREYKANWAKLLSTKKEGSDKFWLRVRPCNGIKEQSK